MHSNELNLPVRIDLTFLTKQHLVTGYRSQGCNSITAAFNCLQDELLIELEDFTVDNIIQFRIEIADKGLRLSGAINIDFPKKVSS